MLKICGVLYSYDILLNIIFFLFIDILIDDRMLFFVNSVMFLFLIFFLKI